VPPPTLGEQAGGGEVRLHRRITLQDQASHA
jgi:hypothetical protein